MAETGSLVLSFVAPFGFRFGLLAWHVPTAAAETSLTGCLLVHTFVLSLFFFFRKIPCFVVVSNTETSCSRDIFDWLLCCHIYSSFVFSLSKQFQHWLLIFAPSFSAFVSSGCSSWLFHYLVLFCFVVLVSLVFFLVALSCLLLLISIECTPAINPSNK